MQKRDALYIAKLYYILYFYVMTGGLATGDVTPGGRGATGGWTAVVARVLDEAGVILVLQARWRSAGWLCEYKCEVGYRRECGRRARGI